MLTASTTIGHYRIERELGQGGMGTVYLAHDERLDRPVALKVISEEQLADPTSRERLWREARAAARLRHPNIVAVHDFIEVDGVNAIIMEYVPGGTLKAILGRRSSVDEVLRLLGPVANALDHAHQMGLVHRDIKPANILLAQDARPVLSDFGIVRYMDDHPGLTLTGEVPGTPKYMAPEQVLGQPATAASDTYALAVIAYEMLCGTHPFHSDTPFGQLFAHITQEPRPPRQVNPALSPLIESVLLRGLHRDPSRRYGSAGAFIGDLAASAPVATMTALPLASVRAPDPSPDPQGMSRPAVPSGMTTILRGPSRTTPPALRGRGRLTALKVVLAAVVVTAAIGAATVLATRGGDGGEATRLARAITAEAGGVASVAPPAPTSTPTTPTPAAVSSPTPTPPRSASPTSSPPSRQQSTEPAQIVLSSADVGSNLPRSQQATAPRPDRLFLASALARLSAGDRAALSRGNGVTLVYSGADSSAPDNPLLFSAAYAFASEDEARAAMTALRAILALSPQRDSNALMQTERKTPYDPPASLGSDSAGLIEYGTRTDTDEEMVAVTTVWRHGLFVSLMTFLESPDADRNVLVQRYNRWLTAQDSHMPGSTLR
jgi:serine/threonine protein kinase